MRLDDPHLLFTSVAMLGSAGAPTVLLRLMLQERVGVETGARWLGPGLALGLAAIAVCALVPALVGGSLEWGHDGALALVGAGLQQLVCLGPTAVGEELLVRGLGFQALARGTRPAIAVAVSGAIFGLLHLSNPNASALAAANVALVGWWLGALTVRTGSLWPAIGVHLAWNFGEGFVFGTPVSGLEPARALVHAVAPEAGFFAGGAFGPEASGFTAAVLLACLVVTCLWPAPRASAPNA
ncbi:MAG: CPBP family intramembrane metalloprotease [Myxococcaceae bacterium]|nr:CPBP family intramembrane metalloprotease [Myxococcaceae bacterium]